MHEGDGDCEDLLRILRRVRQLLLYRAPSEIIGLRREADCAGVEIMLPEPPRDLHRERPHDLHALGLEIILIDIYRRRDLVRDAFRLLLHRRYRARREAMGGRMNIAACIGTQKTGEDRRVEAGRIADRMDADAPELLRGFAAAAVEVADRERPHLRLDLGRVERVDLIRLLEVGGHLREERVARDTDIDREAEGVADLVLDEHRGIHRECKRPEFGGLLATQCPRDDLLEDGAPDHLLGAGHVEEGFIDGELLDDRGILVQDLDEGCGVCAVGLEVGGHEDEGGAELEGLHHRHRRPDAVTLRREGACRDDAVAGFHVTADGRRDRAEVEGCRILAEALHRGPAEKRGVDIDMKDRAVHRASFLRGWWYRCSQGQRLPPEAQYSEAGKI